MAKTNFSGPITTGPIQVNTGTTIGENVRDAAFITNTATFPFTYASFAYATDANRLAVTGSNPTSTETVTLVDATQNVPGITAVGGFEMASMITITSAGADSGKTATVTGTDVFGYTQTEDVSLASAGVATSTKTFKTVTSIVLDSASANTLEVGIVVTGAVSVPLRSLFNANPLSQTSSTSNKNLANNIVIPAFSRISNINMIVTTAFDQNTFIQLGANVAQAAGSTTNTHDLNYFAGASSGTDVKAVGSRHIPVYFVQTTAQSKNCMNVSDDDASGYEVDKAVVMTINCAAAPTAGNAVLDITWLQKINNTN